MTCPWCNYSNPASAAYCGDCGRSLRFEAACPACGAANPEAHGYCDACGAGLQSPVPGPPVAVRAEGPSGVLDAPSSTAAPLDGRPALPLPRLLGSRRVLFAGVAVAVLGQLVLMAAEPSGGPPGFGVLLLVLGVVLFALGSWQSSIGVHDEKLSADIEPPRRIFSGRKSLMSVALGLLLWLVLLLRLVNGSESAWDLVLWLSSALLLTIPFVSRLRVHRRLSRELRTDILVLSALVGIFLALNIRDLDDWYYSAIGDEYAFYLSARAILDDGLSRPFSQSGVYGFHPVLNSAYQAASMAVFGQDNLGWRLASVLSVAVTIPGIYVIGRLLGDRRVAAIAALLFVFSHYMFAYAHTGYNIAHALAPTVWAMAFLFLGLRRQSALLLMVAGLVAGLGLYTHYSARVALVVMAVFAVAHPQLRVRLLGLWPVAVGFVLAAAPIFAVSRGEVVSRMLEQVPGGYSSDVTGPVGERLLANLSKTLLAFNYNPDMFHYVSGPLLDPVTAVLAVLGVGLALGRVRRPHYRFLLVWAIAAMAVTGLLSPYSQVAISRLVFVVPPLALLAGFAGSYLWESVVTALPNSSKRWVGAGLVAMLALVVLTLNVKQFWSDTPKVFHLTQEAVAMGAMRSGACGGDMAATIVVAKATEPLLRPALIAYSSHGTLPRLIDHGDLGTGEALALDAARCVIFVHPEERAAQEALKELGRRYTGWRPVSFSDRAGKGTVTIFVPGAG